MLIGISLGPGDPELMTLKAVAALKRCKKVFVSGEKAAELARPYSVPEVLHFPMIKDKNELERNYKKNAEAVARFALSESVGFACIGDVNTFSTFNHIKRAIKQSHPEIEVMSIPGVSVVPALAARLDIALESTFTVSDGSPAEWIIRMKATRPKKQAEELRQEGFDEFILGTKLCTPQENIIKGEMPEKSEYFSVLLAHRRRR